MSENIISNDSNTTQNDTGGNSREQSITVNMKVSYQDGGEKFITPIKGVILTSDDGGKQVGVAIPYYDITEARELFMSAALKKQEHETVEWLGRNGKHKGCFTIINSTNTK